MNTNREIPHSVEPTLIFNRVYDPTKSLFKTNANERAEHQQIFCTNLECVLLKNNQCICADILRSYCPYGSYKVEKGPTKRAKKFRNWIQSKKTIREAPNPKSASRKLTRIKDYIYLPYSFMDMNEKLPFLAHEGFMTGGRPFLPLKNWTLETVEEILAFRPRALFGGQISSYQKEELPKFLNHLREEEPELWTKLIVKHPEYNKAPDYSGRTALLSSLKTGITFTVSNQKEVVWEWDGKYLKSTSPKSYSQLYGSITAISVEVCIVPSPDTTIKVQSNDWVTPETVFVD